MIHDNGVVSVSDRDNVKRHFAMCRASAPSFRIGVLDSEPNDLWNVFFIIIIIRDRDSDPETVESRYIAVAAAPIEPSDQFKWNVLKDVSCSELVMLSFWLFFFECFDLQALAVVSQERHP